jgi:Asp-tRNA(Asn)/Glu-tRNA(Gln) amidotransferase A subunit family amidase
LVASVLETTEIGEALLSGPASSDVYANYPSARNVSGRKRLLRLASRIAEAARDAYQETFRTVDLLVTPTLPVTAPRFVDTTSPWQLPGKPFGELLSRYTRIVSFIGHPAISVPCGMAIDGMPIGLQIIGRPFEEETVLQAAYRYERAVGEMQRPSGIAEPSHPTPPAPNNQYWRKQECPQNL